MPRVTNGVVEKVSAESVPKRQSALSRTIRKKKNGSQSSSTAKGISAERLKRLLAVARADAEGEDDCFRDHSDEEDPSTNLWGWRTGNHASTGSDHDDRLQHLSLHEDVPLANSNAGRSTAVSPASRSFRSSVLSNSSLVLNDDGDIVEDHRNGGLLKDRFSLGVAEGMAMLLGVTEEVSIQSPEEDSLPKNTQKLQKRKSSIMSTSKSTSKFQHEKDDHNTSFTSTFMLDDEGMPRLSHEEKSNTILDNSSSSCDGCSLSIPESPSYDYKHKSPIKELDVAHSVENVEPSSDDEESVALDELCCGKLQSNSQEMPSNDSIVISNQENCGRKQDVNSFDEMDLELLDVKNGKLVSDNQCLASDVKNFVESTQNNSTLLDGICADNASSGTTSINCTIPISEMDPTPAFSSCHDTEILKNSTVDANCNEKSNFPSPLSKTGCSECKEDKFSDNDEQINNHHDFVSSFDLEKSIEVDPNESQRHCNLYKDIKENDVAFEFSDKEEVDAAENIEQSTSSQSPSENQAQNQTKSPFAEEISNESKSAKSNARKKLVSVYMKLLSSNLLFSLLNLKTKMMILAM